MYRIRSLAICFMLLFFIKTLIGQEYIFDHISLEDGLSQSSINAIAQDQKGFLWIGTQDGLNRFDGNNFKVFKKNPLDSNSLTNSFITALLVDDKDRLWIGTLNGGLFLYKPIQETFQHFSADDTSNSISNNIITTIYQDRQGTIWVGTANGFNQLIIDEDDSALQVSFKCFKHAEEADSELFYPHYIKSIYHAKNDYFWVGTLNGVFLYRLDKDGKLYYTNEKYNYSREDKYSISSNNIADIQEDENGVIWIGTTNGLNKFVPNINGFIRVDLFDNIRDTKQPKINCITKNRNGDLLIGTESGVNILNYTEGKYEDKFITYTKDAQNSSSLHAKNIIVIHEDQVHKELYWCGTALAGIGKMYKQRKKFNTCLLDRLPGLEAISPSVGFLLKDSIERLWIGLEDGILIYKPKEEYYRVYKNIQVDSFIIDASIVRNVFMDKQGQIWGGTTRYGLFRFGEIQEETIHAEMYWSDYECEDRSVFAFYETEKEYLIGSYSGINVLDKYSNHLLPCPVNFVPNHGKGLEYRTQSFLLDRNNNLWIGSSFGLVLVRNVKEPIGQCLQDRADSQSYSVFTKKELTDENIMEIYQDINDNIWLTTFGGGILKVIDDGKDLEFVNYNESDGLANNVVYGMLEDEDNGQLWLSTNSGLSRFDPQTEHFDNFNISDGLQNSEFNNYAFFQCDDGEMIFGGVSGITSFYPSKIKLEEQTPSVWITHLKTADDEKTNRLTNDRDKPIELAYTQNSFFVKFIGVDFLHPKDLKYFYNIEGASEKDIPIGNSQQINFTKLSPGTYNLQIKAMGKSGLMSSLGDSIKIKILSPFWRSYWFFTLLIGALIISIWLIYHARYKSKMRRIAEIERIRKSAAEDFHDELGSKLSIISMYGELTKKQMHASDAESSRYLTKVIDTSNTLYGSMKDLIWTLNPEQDTLSDLYLQLKDFGEDLFMDTGIIFQANGILLEQNELRLPMHYKRHILLIFKEAMNNALRHANCSLVILKMSNYKEHLQIEFFDDGIGFDHTKESSGDGIQNMKNRANKIQGDLSIIPDKSGTTIQLSCSI